MTDLKPSVAANVSQTAWSLQPKQLLPNLFAGLIVGLVTLVYSISCAALIFSGELSAYLPLGIRIAMVGAMLSAILVTILSSQPFTISGCDPKSAVLLGGMTTAIAQQLPPNNATNHLLPTVWMAIALTSLLTGLVLFLLGRLRLGQLARFIPYPVMGGFLAGTGWLIARSSFKVMAGVAPELATLPQLAEVTSILQWLPGVVFAVVLLIVSGRYKHYLVIPSFLGGSIILFQIFRVGLNQLSLGERTPDWFFQPASGGAPPATWGLQLLGQTDWAVVLGQSTTMMAVAIVVVIATLLETTGLEIATQKDFLLDRELRGNGIANGVIGLLGGLVTSVSVNRSFLNYRAGASGVLSGVLSGLLCGLVLLSGDSFLVYFPKPIFGGLLLYLGLTLLYEWLYKAWFKLPRLDYFLVIAILVIIAVGNFVVGVGAGILTACLLFIVNYSRSRSVRYAFSGSTYQSNAGRSLQQQRFLRQEGDQIYLLTLQGYIFFGTANALLDRVRQRLNDPDLPKLRFLVLDFRLTNGLDSSAVLSFVKMRKLAQAESFTLVLTHLSSCIEKQLLRGQGLDPEDDQCQQFPDLDRGMEWCENRLLETTQWRRNRYVPLSLQLNALFADPDQAPVFMDYLEEIDVPAGQELFHQGDRPDAIYLIESGRVSLLLQLEDGQNRRLQTVGESMIVGEIAGVRQTAYPVTAIADERSTLFRLSETAFQTMQRQHPQAAIAFLEVLTSLLNERLLYASKEIRELLQ